MYYNIFYSFIINNLDIIQYIIQLIKNYFKISAILFEEYVKLYKCNILVDSFAIQYLLPGSIVEITGSECAFLLSIPFPFRSSSSSLSVLIANRIVPRPANNLYYHY